MAHSFNADGTIDEPLTLQRYKRALRLHNPTLWFRPRALEEDLDFMRWGFKLMREGDGR